METYETTALYAAAALYANGARLEAVTHNDAGRRVFIFSDPNGDLRDLENAYWRGTLPTVQPRAYVDALVKVRDKMYAAAR